MDGVITPGLQRGVPYSRAGASCLLRSPKDADYLAEESDTESRECYNIVASDNFLNDDPRQRQYNQRMYPRLTTKAISNLA